jgi:hypothetical protein
MNYPTYWNQDGDTFWLETGGPIISATLTVQSNTVEFEFYDGEQRYSRRREFPNPVRAKNWACKFGRFMRQLDQQNSVPLPRTFEEFKFSIF